MSGGIRRESRGGQGGDIPVTPGLVVILGFLSMGSAFATDTYLPALPAVADDLATTPALAQLTLSIFLISQAVGNLLIGPLSDRWGRLRPLIASNCLFVLAGAGAALAPDIGTLLIMRAVQGAASAAGPVIARAVVADLSSGQAAARLFSVLTMIFGLAPIVAPVIGGPIAEWGGWRAVMWTIVLISAFALLGSLLLPESHPPNHRRKSKFRVILGDYWRLMRSADYLMPTLIGMASFGIVMSWLTASSFVMQMHYGASPTVYALAFAVVAGGYLLGGLLNAALLRRFSVRNLLRASAWTAALLSIGALVLGILEMLPDWGLVSLMAAVFAASAALTANAIALALAAVPRHSVGSASALLGAVQFVIPGLLSPLLGVAGVTPVPMLVGCAGYALLVLGVLVLLRRRPATMF